MKISSVIYQYDQYFRTLWAPKKSISCGKHARFAHKNVRFSHRNIAFSHPCLHQNHENMRFSKKGNNIIKSGKILLYFKASLSAYQNLPLSFHHFLWIILRYNLGMSYFISLEIYFTWKRINDKIIYRSGYLSDRQLLSKPNKAFL